MAVILIVACSFYGRTQTPKTPKYGSGTFITIVKANDSTLNEYFPDIFQAGADTITSGNNKVYIMTEKMPQFPGGDDSLMHFFRKSIRIERVIDHGHGIQRIVVVRFIISKSGSVTHVEVVRSLDPASDKEAIRVIKLLPDFIPGKQNGVNVPVYFTLPISFKLD